MLSLNIYELLAFDGVVISGVGDCLWMILLPRDCYKMGLDKEKIPKPI